MLIKQCPPLSLLRVKDMRFQNFFAFSARYYFKNVFVGRLYQKLNLKLSFGTKSSHKGHYGVRFLGF